MQLHPNPGVEELERLRAQLDALDQDLLDAGLPEPVTEAVA